MVGRSGERPLDLFVMHAASDAGFVHGYLLPSLNVPPSRRLLIDELTPGALVIAEIDRGVSSRLVIVVLSPACLEDRWTVFGEQLASYLSVEGVPVIPLRLADCELPVHLKARVPLDFTDRARWDAGAARLRELLGTAAPELEPARCPYPGMRPFAADEASQFCGRAGELDDLVGRLDRGEREIYVIGPSGSGKSSLVHAGLLHKLRSGSRLGSFVVCEMRPGERPAERLEQALAGESTAAAPGIDALLACHPPGARVLVFVDQLEELFTLADAGERRRFITALRGLRAEPRCFLLLALRADFFGALMDSALWPDRARPISRLEVAPLRGAALAQAITEPAARAGVHVEPRLCDRLVADADDEPGALPLVQETLRILWDKRRHRSLGLAEYHALGGDGRGLHVAIAWHADATLRRLTGEQQAIALRVLLRLVSFGEGRPDTRRQQPVQALRSTADDEAAFAFVLQHLVDSRLITITAAGGGSVLSHEALVDLAHEALITAWPVLREGLAVRRADEQRRRRIEARVAEWIDRGRGTARLLDPVELAEVMRWIASDAARELGHGPGLPALVAASRRQLEELDRQTHARRRFLAMTYLDQGRALLLGGRPMQALPYLVAARAEHIESRVLRLLFAEAARNLPLVTFAGHAGLVRKAVFSPDGARVVTASWDHTAQVWDAATGVPIGPRLVHRDAVLAVAFSSDGTRIATASKDGTARVWDARTGGPVTPPLEHASVVHAAGFSRDGARLVTASSDRTARIWDASTGEPLARPLAHHDSVYAAAFSADAARVVTASYDKTARIWDAATGAPAAPPLQHHAGVHAVAFSPDGTRVATASYDHTARIWSATSGAAVTPPLVHDGIVAAAVFSPDGARVVTASYDRTARVWSAATGAPATPPLEHRGIVSAAGFCPAGTRVVTASHDKTARVWCAVTGKPQTAPLEHHGDVRAAAFSPDGTRVITASADRTARIWDAPAAVIGPRLDHRDAIAACAFSANGERAVTASEDRTARVWDAATGAPVTPPLVHRGEVHAAAFSTDGARVVTASWDKTARVWDAATGAPVTPPLLHHGAVWRAVFSPEGARVVTASWDTTARIWDAVTGAPVTPPLEHEGAVWTAAFSPDGARLVTASRDHRARIWDAATGALVASLAHDDMVLAAAFSPDGARLVTAGADATARIWSATGQPMTPALEHQNAVHAAVFSPDGTRVVTASRDGTARVWDAATGKPVTPPLEHQDEVHVAAFSPDGALVITASCDRTARLWDAATGKAVAPPLEHHDAVSAAAFDPAGARVLTASRDGTAQVWSLPDDAGSLADWQVLARCSPFALVDNVLTSNGDPTRCVPQALRPGPRSQGTPHPDPDELRVRIEPPVPRPAPAPPRSRGCRSRFGRHRPRR
jgi:WD40 repeat protein